MKSSATNGPAKNGNPGIQLPAASQKETVTASAAAGETPSQAEAAKAPAAPQIRLLPVNGSDQPVLANYTTLELAPGLAYLDFGFIEPSVIEAVQSAVQSKTPLPQRISGRMAARVALGLDQLHALHRQIGTAIGGLESMARQQLAAYAQAMETRKKP